MTTASSDPHSALRKSIYAIFIAVGIGAVVGRILAVDAVDRRALADTVLKQKLADKKAEIEKSGLSPAKADEAIAAAKSRMAVERGLWRPFLSANDRSRWCTVRALVEPAMRVDGAPYSIDKVIQEPGWDTIDMIKRGEHLYSSKPPLLPTLIAAEYWIIFHTTGMTLGSHPYEVGRFMLITINGLCLLLFFIYVARLIERLGTTDWGRIFVAATCVFGTFLTTFAVVLTNHLVAAACAVVLLDILVRIWLDGDRRAWSFVVAGFASAMLTANELPAAAFSVAASVVLLFVAPRKTFLAYLPAALLVVAGFFGTNWIAVQSLNPAYAHRGSDDNWYDYSYKRGDRTIDSYWRNPQGIDRGEPSVGRYALHVLVGSHGIFSLTPIWWFALIGGGMWLFRESDRRLRMLSAMVLLISIVCVTFYILRPTIDRNYGGMASAFRWVFWLAPLWLTLMLPAADAMSKRRWMRWLAAILLAASALSASYPTWNPWTAPWIVNASNHFGSM